jgi:hypothetical protein
VTVTNLRPAGLRPFGAAVRSDLGDPFPANDSAQAETTVLPRSDVQIDMSPMAGTTLVGSGFYAGFTPRATGPDVATNVHVTIVLPPSTPPGVFVYSERWDCSEAAGVVSCFVASMVPFSSGEINEIFVRFTTPASPGTMTVQASISADLPDNDLSNNQDSAQVTLVPVVVPRDMAIVSIKVPKKVKLLPGGPAVSEYVYATIQNQGASEITVNWFAGAISTTLYLESLGGCPDVALAGWVGGQTFQLPAGKTYSSRFYVTFDPACVNDPLKGPGHEDYRLTFITNTYTLQFTPDADPADDICPRPARPGGASDPWNPKNKDKGCGGKGAGTPVLIDVQVK